MSIRLTKEELEYMHGAINEWHKGALEQVENETNYKYILLQRNRINGVKELTAELDSSWKENEGEIALPMFNQILQCSVHTNMQSPILLSIKQKHVEAFLANKAPQKHSPVLDNSQDEEDKIQSPRHGNNRAILFAATDDKAPPAYDVAKQNQQASMGFKN